MADDDAPEVLTVTIASREITVKPQPLMYVHRRLKLLAKTVNDLDLENDLAAVLVAETGYKVVCAFIPDVQRQIKPYEWLGYESEEAMAADDLDETRPPHPPTFPELRAAFRAVKQVNGVDVFEGVLGGLDPQMRQGLLSDLVSLVISTITPTLPSPEDGSEALTSSTPTGPTSTGPISDSPSLASVA